MSSESQLPETDPSVSQASLDWNALSSLTTTDHRNEFEDWLNDQLDEMERSLNAFVSSASRLKGLR